MSALTKTTVKNRSGVVGVSRAKRKRAYADGREVMRYFWTAQCGQRVVRFSVDNLGEREAYREAVRARREWVLAQAPKQLARKKAYRSNRFKRYRQRYREHEAKRVKEYFDANRDKINARRRAHGKAKRRAAK